MSSPRIASLLPSATEICCSLGLGEHLVGVSHECDYPPQVRGTRVLTSSRIDSSLDSARIDAQVREALSDGLSLYGVDERALVEAAPDLVITQDTCDVCAVPFADVVASVRRRLGPQVEVLSLRPSSLEDVFGDIAQVGRAAGVESRAVETLEQLRLRVDRMREGAPQRPRRVLHLEWLEPPMVAGHWTPELLRIAGAEPVLGHDGKPTRAESWAAIEQCDAELVVLAPCGYPLAKTREELEALLAHESFSRVAERAPIWGIDGNAYFNRPGPRLVDSAELVAAIIRDGHGVPSQAELLR